MATQAFSKRAPPSITRWLQILISIPALAHLDMGPVSVLPASEGQNGLPRLTDVKVVQVKAHQTH